MHQRSTVSLLFMLRSTEIDHCSREKIALILASFYELFALDAIIPMTNRRSIPNEKVCFPHRHAYQRVQGFSCMERALCVMQNKDCSYTPSFYNIPLFVLFSLCSLAFYLFHSVYFFICFTTARFLVWWKCHSFLTDLSTAAAVLFVPSFVPKPFPQRQLMIQSDQRFVWPKHLRAVFLYFHTLAQNSFSLLSLPVLLPTCLPVVNLLLLTSFSHPTLCGMLCAHITPCTIELGIGPSFGHHSDMYR